MQHACTECIYWQKHIMIPANPYIFQHIHIHTYIYIYIFIYTHIYLYIYIYTHVELLLSFPFIWPIMISMQFKRHSKIKFYVTPLAFSIHSNTCNTCWSIKSSYHFIRTAYTLSLELISSNRLCPNQELRTADLADIVYQGVILPNRYVKS